MSYQQGQELFRKTTGELVFFDRFLNEEEMLVSHAVVYQQGCPDSGIWEEAVSSEAKYVVKIVDYVDVQPEQAIPKYLAEDIERAERRLDALCEQYESVKRTLAEERQKHTDFMQGIKVRTQRLTPKRKRLIELTLAHLEGVDLLVLNVGNTSHAVKRLSDFKGDYGFRMLGLHGDFSSGDKKYDWNIHQYSDDSGGWSHCLVAETMEELKLLAIEFKNEIPNSDWRKYNFLKFLAEQFGYVLNNAEETLVKKAEEEKAESAKKAADRELQNLLLNAKKLGYELHRVDDQVSTNRHPDQP